MRLLYYGQIIGNFFTLPTTHLTKSTRMPAKKSRQPIRGARLEIDDADSCMTELITFIFNFLCLFLFSLYLFYIIIFFTFFLVFVVFTKFFSN